MSSLNLVPNLNVMAVQAGIFVANFYAIKKLMLEPYLKVYDKRQNLTVGSKAEAKELVAKNESAIQQIQQALREANDAAATIRESSQSQANLKRDELISAAENEAKGIISGIESEIETVLKEETPKIPKIVDQLSNVIVDQILEA